MTTPRTAPDPPAPPSAIAAANPGSGSVGNASGSGYNPYAYASYRAPPPAGAPIIVSSGDLARLETALREHVPTVGVQMTAHVDIDNQGRIIRFVPDSALPPDAAAKITAVALGFALCAPDPTRPIASDILLSLRI